MKSTLKKKISAERHGFSARILHWNTAVWTYPYLHFHMAGFRSVVEAWTGVHREKVKGKDLLLFCVLDPVLDFSYKYWCKILPRIPQCEHEQMIAEAAIQKGFFSTPRLCLYIFILVGGSLQGTYVSYIQLIMQMVGGCLLLRDRSSTLESFIIASFVAVEEVLPTGKVA